MASLFLASILFVASLEMHVASLSNHNIGVRSHATVIVGVKTSTTAGGVKYCVLQYLLSMLSRQTWYTSIAISAPLCENRNHTQCR